MNKVGLYISILIASLLLACSQQNESRAYLEDQFEMVEEESMMEPYYWEDEAVSNQALEKQNEVALSEVSNKEKKLLKAFVKQNIQDFIELASLYTNESYNLEVSAVVQSQILEYTENLSFEELEHSLLFSQIDKKKLKLNEILVVENEGVKGTISVVVADESSQLFYRIITKQNEFGVSRDFKIYAITTE